MNDTTTLAVPADYLGFAARTEEADLYVSYQSKYRHRPKVCEIVTLELVEARSNGEGDLLDVGCSTGNFVSYLHDELPGFAFTGIDLMPQAVAEADAKDLERAQFAVYDLLRGSNNPEGALRTDHFDFVTFQTVVYAFTDVQFKAALQRARQALKPGGFCILFDNFHPFEASYEIIERSIYHPDGHPIHMRPLSLVRRFAGETGFHVDEVLEFHLPPDLLPLPYDPHDLTSYVKGGQIMRGPLSQPFCHMVLRAK